MNVKIFDVAERTCDGFTSVEEFEAAEQEARMEAMKQFAMWKQAKVIKPCETGGFCPNIIGVKFGRYPGEDEKPPGYRIEVLYD